MNKMSNFLATDKVPETVFGIPVVTKDYTPEDLAFFKAHPEAGGYYDTSDDNEPAASPPPATPRGPEGSPEPEPPEGPEDIRGALKAGEADELVDRINSAVDMAIPFIKEHEGFRDKAYQDSIGKWTIGYRQTEIDGRPVKEGDVIDEPTAAKFVTRRVRRNAADLYRNSSWTNNASANALAALYDLAYNMGIGALSEKKSPTLNRTGRAAVGTNAVDAAIWAQVPTYVKAGGKKLKGLMNRRQHAIDKWRK